MNNSEKNFSIQSKLFEEIRKNLPRHRVLADVISEVLDIGIDSTYRRIRCKTLLSIKETYTLCQHFNLSLDMLIGNKNIHQLDYIYRPITLSMPNGYQNYILSLSNHFGKLRTSDDSAIFMSAIDIPVFHLVSYKELIYLKIYAWVQSTCNYEGYFDTFLKEIDSTEIVRYQQKIVHDYEYIPSAEIWTENTINTTLKLIKYYIEIGMFMNKDMPMLICEHVLNILNKLQKWAEDSRKSEHNTPFHFYLSEIDFENSYVLMKHSGQKSCVVKVFTLNSLIVSDREFCIETEKCLTKLAQRSVLLCGSSEKERVKFFNSQRQKIRSLMEKINQSF